MHLARDVADAARVGLRQGFELAHLVCDALDVDLHALGDGCGLFGEHCRATDDAVDVAHDAFDLARGPGQRLHRFGLLMHLSARVADPVDDRGDRAVDFVEARLGALGKLPDLIRDDREASALLSGARRLDRGVEREEVGLVGDLRNGAEHILDALDALGKLGEVACEGVAVFDARIDGRKHCGDLPIGVLERLLGL